MGFLVAVYPCGACNGAGSRHQRPPDKAECLCELACPSSGPHPLSPSYLAATSVSFFLSVIVRLVTVCCCWCLKLPIGAWLCFCGALGWLCLEDTRPAGCGAPVFAWVPLIEMVGAVRKAWELSGEVLLYSPLWRVWLCADCYC